MKKQFLCLSLIVATALSTSSFKRMDVVGNEFPILEGQTLTKKKITLPADIKGKPTFIVLASSKKAETELSTWLNPVYNKLVAKTSVMGSMIDANMYFVPMFTGTLNITNDIAMKQLSEDTNRQYYPYIICYRGKLHEYKETLEMPDKTKAYIFVLDKEGKIIYQTSGAFDEKKMEVIEDKLNN